MQTPTTSIQKKWRGTASSNVQKTLPTPQCLSSQTFVNYYLLYLYLPLSVTIDSIYVDNPGIPAPMNAF
jgi:hypothetical protein